MAELGLDASQETRITVMQLKIERLEEKQEELRERLKVVEPKWYEHRYLWLVIGFIVGKI